MEKFDTGAARSSRIPRYDLIPAIALERLAQRFTGKLLPDGTPDGGALEYGECNWMKGIPTSEVYNHIISHLNNWADSFRFALAKCGNDMEGIKSIMASHSMRDDDLAGAMWGISVLMHQEKFGMFHDTKFPSTPPPSVDLGDFDPLACCSEAPTGIHNPECINYIKPAVKEFKVLSTLEAGKCYKIISVWPELKYEVVNAI